MKPTNRRLRALTLSDVDDAICIIHETAIVSEDALVGPPGEWRDHDTRFPACLDENVVVREFATVHAGCERPTLIGARTLLMTKSHVGHDSKVGTDCDIAPGAVIGGCVTIGNRVKIGMNASIRPHVTVGDDARIGMGAVVLKDVPAGETWAGNPARRIR